MTASLLSLSSSSSPTRPTKRSAAAAATTAAAASKTAAALLHGSVGSIPGEGLYDHQHSLNGSSSSSMYSSSINSPALVVSPSLPLQFHPKQNHRRRFWGTKTSSTSTLCFGLVLIGMSILQQILVSRRIITASTSIRSDDASLATPMLIRLEEPKRLSLSSSSSQSTDSRSYLSKMRTAKSAATSTNMLESSETTSILSTTTSATSFTTPKARALESKSVSLVADGAIESQKEQEQQPQQRHSRIVHWTLATATTMTAEDTVTAAVLLERSTTSTMRYPHLSLARPPPSPTFASETMEMSMTIVDDDHHDQDGTTTHGTNTGGPRSDKGPMTPHEKDVYSWEHDCVPMASWQTSSFPVCNVLHEVNVEEYIVSEATAAATATASEEGRRRHNDDESKVVVQQRQSTEPSQLSLLSTKGSWRTVWKLQRQLLLRQQHDNSVNNETVAIKFLKMHRSFDKEAYEVNRIDALAMERLTSSPHIVDIYAYCGQSVISEYAAGNARTFVKNESLSLLDRLVLGRDMAQALADLHSIDYPNATNVTLTHNDLNMANLVEVNGRIKLNDFNIGILQRWNTSSDHSQGSTCRTPVQYAAPLWKSPEEIRNASAVDAAAADVFGLGNLLFQVLTRRQPWTHLEPHGPLTSLQAAEAKVAGGQPFVPTKYRGQESPTTAATVIYAALYKAVQACFATQPQQRPTAHEIAQELDGTVQYILQQVHEWKKAQRDKEQQQQHRQKHRSATTTATSRDKKKKRREPK